MPTVVLGCIKVQIKISCSFPFFLLLPHFSFSLLLKIDFRILLGFGFGLVFGRTRDLGMLHTPAKRIGEKIKRMKQKKNKIK